MRWGFNASSTGTRLLSLSTIADAKISNPPWVSFQSAGWVSFQSAPTGKRIKERLRDGTITPEQAINEALKVRQYFDAAPELQGNFALTRAYLADESGSKAGLGGANCFIDLSLFATPIPEWITFSKTVDWESRGMKAQFGSLTHLDHEAAGRVQSKGVLSAFDIAKTLSNDHEIEAVLRQERFRIVR